MTLSVLIAVTHLLGIGHLSRAAAIARALAGRGHQVTLVSGGLPAPLVTAPGARMVQLPPVQTRLGDFRTLLDEAGHPAGPERMTARRHMIAAEIDRARPDILVTELFPFGRRVLADEFLAAIAHAKEGRPDTLVACSIRDILIAPERPGKLGEAHQRLARLYDAILVHGDAALAPLSASWPLDPALEARLRYTGYVDSAEAVAAPPSVFHPDQIVVSGGGSAAGLVLFEAALEASRIVRDRPWLILVGAGVTESRFAALRSEAPAHVGVERARAGFRQILSASALSVSQAGYNTVIDILSAGVRAVLVPFEQGQETEQRQRADLIAARGGAVMLAEAALSGPALARAVQEALDRPPPSRLSVQLDGAERSARALEDLAASREVSARPAVLPGRTSGWRALSEALDRAEDAGLHIPVWWRDDDAVSDTPALSRLIALARRLECPLALAAIPALADISLAARVADEPLVRILVHGWAHRNHAEAGAKKAEFGPGRPLGEARHEAEAALACAETLFGERLTAIFVPPWNRIDPALAAALPSLGYAGLSTFRAAQVPHPATAFRRIETHLDPIEWRSSRELADPDLLLSGLASDIVARTRPGAAPDPIGLLTHHLVSSEAVWSFCERLIEALGRHPAIRLDPIDRLAVTPQWRHVDVVAFGDGDGLEMVAQGLT